MTPRPAPQTCVSCKYCLIQRPDWNTTVCGLMANKAFRDAHPEISGPWDTARMPLQVNGVEFGCTLHDATPSTAEP